MFVEREGRQVPYDEFVKGLEPNSSGWAAIYDHRALWEITVNCTTAEERVDSEGKK